MYFFILSPLLRVDYKEIIAFILRLYKRDMTLGTFDIDLTLEKLDELRKGQ